MNKENEINKLQLANFGRIFALLFNRSFMYSANHPFQIEAINSTHQALTRLLQHVSPSVFILNGEKFYMDEEPLDPRVNVSKIAAHFKKTGIESVSFYEGASKKELQLFLEIANSLSKYPNAEAMSKAMFKKQIDHIKINHIFYKKVSAEDEVVSRDMLDKVSPELMGGHQDNAKQMFMESIFNNVLQDELLKNLNLNNLLINTAGLSKEMIAADLSAVKQHNSKNPNPNDIANPDDGKKEELCPGQFLLHQLSVLDHDMERSLSEERAAELPKIADALFDMRQKLIEGIEAQKALGVAYANEEEIISKTTEITDKVLIRLIKEEYKTGKTSVSRLARILCRLIPEADELKRLLPKIKAALLEEGMSQADFIDLIRNLGNELESDGLVNILSEGAEEIGIDRDEIIRELKENPRQSAEMVYLASEIRKRGGDKGALTDLIVNYTEKLCAEYSKDLTLQKGTDTEKNIGQALAEAKSDLVCQLGNLDIKEDILTELEERVSQRMDEIFNKLRAEWVNSHRDTSEQQKIHKESTVLETLERGVSEEEGLGQILKIIRKKAEAGEIDENDFDQIYPEIVKQEKLIKSSQEQKGSPSGIMRDHIFADYLEKEIVRAKRYKTSLSALGFSLVKVKSKTNLQPDLIQRRDVTDALSHKLVEIFRTPDIIGEVRKNQFIVLLPMTHRGQANQALRRAMKILHLNPLKVGGIALEIKVAGVAADIGMEDTVNAGSLVDLISSQLRDMATRISNLHSY